MQFKLDHRLARLLGIHTQTRPFIVNALWQYIKTHKLQDSSEREYINCDKYFEQASNGIKCNDIFSNNFSHFFPYQATLDIW